MDPLIDYAAVRITALRPVHVGSGKLWRRDVNVKSIDDQAYLIDPDAFWQTYIEQHANEVQSINDFLGIQTDEVIEEVLRTRIESGTSPHWAHPLDTRIYGSELRGQMRNPLIGNPILPGSSIKGALRTALMRMVGEADLVAKWEQINKKFLLNPRGNKGNNAYMDNGYIRELLRTISIREPDDTYAGRFEKALTRHLRIPDVVFPSVEWWNVKIGGRGKNSFLWKDGRNNNYREEFRPGEFVSAVEAIPERAVQISQWGLERDVRIGNNHRSAFVKNEKWKAMRNGHIPSSARAFYGMLFQYINQYMWKYLLHEMRFYGWADWTSFDDDKLISKVGDAYDKNEWPGEEYDYQVSMMEDLWTLYRELDASEEENGQTNTCLLRLGWGSGFHAMTGDWQYGDHLEPLEHQGRVKLKTRKVFFKDWEDGGFAFALPGFVKLELCTDT